MPERTGQILKLICLILAALLAYQLVRLAPRINPLSGVVIPALPTLAEKTNAPPVIAKGTNSVKSSHDTNKPGELVGTNSPSIKSTNAAGSNLVAAVANAKAGTNSPALATTNTADTAETTKTNVEAAATSTNVTAVAPASSVTETNGTNLATGTNIAVPPAIAGTNGSNIIVAANVDTNALPGKKARKGGTDGPSAMMRAGMGMNPRGTPAPELPPEVRARITRIYESEILAQVIHPLPMGLIGIAGDLAFLRTASGQTGMIKEGETLGDLKLIQIGTNRVVVEAAGQKKELTIFEGYGSKSLLPSEKENQNEKANN